MNKRQIYKISIILALGVFIILPIFASAAPDAGIKPGSFFYFFDTAFEKINLFFTFNPEKKAQKAMEYAEERLAEVEAIANENKPEAVATAMTNYQENVSFATKETKTIEDRTKTENLLSIIADKTSKHQEILAEVYNRVPNEAKNAIEKAIEISAKGQENALKEMKGLKKTVEELQKDIESLKQKEQSDQGKEIETLRQEIEALKSQKIPAQPRTNEKAIEKITEVPPPTAKKSTTELSNSAIIEKMKPAVVYIQTGNGSGSGMIIENDGYVLTNAHVVSGADTAKIKLSDGRLFIGSVVGRDEKIDLALLKINGNNFPVVILGDSSTGALKQGDEVFSFGYPFGLEGDVSFKEGTISRRQNYEGVDYLETSAEIHPGNSGGPLVNKYGEVVGVNTAALGRSMKGVTLGETIKLAIPINIARGLIQELKAGRSITMPKIILPSPSSLSPSPTPTPTLEPKIITNARVDMDTRVENSVWIYWKVENQSLGDLLSSQSKIYYSKNGGLNDAKVVSTSGNGNVPIYNLEQGTKYYYQIVVDDEIKSDILNFTTKNLTPARSAIREEYDKLKAEYDSLCKSETDDSLNYREKLDKSSKCDKLLLRMIELI